MGSVRHCPDIAFSLRKVELINQRGRRNEADEIGVSFKAADGTNRFPQRFSLKRLTSLSSQQGRSRSPESFAQSTTMTKSHSQHDHCPAMPAPTPYPFLAFSLVVAKRCRYPCPARTRLVQTDCNAASSASCQLFVPRRPFADCERSATS